MNHPAILAAVLAHTRTRYGLTIHDKGASLFMRTLYVVSFMWLWNRRFMTGYWTTIAGKCWAPMPLEDNDWRTVTHEGKHAEQSARIGEPWMSIAYLFPQCLAPLALLALLAFPFSSYWLLALGFLGTLLPWPAPWRAKYEAEAYTVSLTCDVLGGAAPLTDGRYIDIYAAKFGQAYFLPIWGNRKRRDRAIAMITAARLALEQGKGDPYLLDIIATVRTAQRRGSA